MRFNKQKTKTSLELVESIDEKEWSHFIKTIINLSYGNWDNDVFANPTSNRKKFRDQYRWLERYLNSIGSKRSVRDYDIHHMDGDHTNNNPSNIVFLTHSRHSELTNLIVTNIVNSYSLSPSIPKIIVLAMSYIYSGLFYLFRGLGKFCSQLNLTCSVTLTVGKSSITINPQQVSNNPHNSNLIHMMSDTGSTNDNGTERKDKNDTIMRGIEELLISNLFGTEGVDSLLTHIMDITKKTSEQFIRDLGESDDVIRIGDGDIEGKFVEKGNKDNGI